MSTDMFPNWRSRLPYLSIVNRPKFELPNNARVAVWSIVNIENWVPEAPMPRAVLTPPMGSPLLPDLPNWACHEYGNRVGFWRIHEMFKKRNLKATFAVNGSAIEIYEEVCRAARDSEWEFMGHGWTQKPSHKVEDEAQAIAQTIEAIRKMTGAPPRGWESPGLTETEQTVDLLAAAGIEYVADWVIDDQPVYVNTRSGPIATIPYTVEINDVPMLFTQFQRSDEIFRRGKDQFDRLYEEGKSIPRVMAISCHPYISGVPHRIGYLEALYDYILSHEGVIMATGGEIIDCFKNSPAGQL